DYTILKRQAFAAAQSASKNNSISSHNQVVNSMKQGNVQDQAKTSNETDTKQTPQIFSFPNTKTENNILTSNNTTPNLQQLSNFHQNQQIQLQNRQPWEHVDEIMSILKTAYPLLALSMETMVDQIQQRFKCTPDEDAYRLIVALLNDGIQVYKQKLLFFVVVLQCGADSLAGDRLGCFNLSMKGHAECVKFVKSFNLPTIAVGGGGYTIRNVARVWTYETAVLINETLDENIPFNSYLDYYGPEFKLNVPSNNMENQNSRAYLENITSKVIDNLRNISHAPSVQIQHIPPDFLFEDEINI
ncbi:unnamed protein product, partial [Pneumocystis jirovecii]